MSRTKEFDVAEALDRAVEVFWRKGYEGTSLRDLQESMGIGRQSLYDTFGDKHRLFVAAVERYNARNFGRLQEMLPDETASLPELRGYFEKLVEFLTPRGERPGCLLANSILEVGDDDAEVARCCRAGERRVKRAFTDALARAADRGELTNVGDADEAAGFLLAQVYGMTVMAKGGATRPALRKVVDRAFASFGDGSSHATSRS